MLTTAVQPAPSPVQVQPAVRVQSLRKVIGERVVLREVSFDIAPGSLVALLGANGAGKSTLLKILAGLTAPTIGRVEICGKDVTKEASSLRSRIGYIGHNSMLYRDLSAMENLVFFARLHGLPNARRRVDELLEQLGLAGRGDDPLKAYSRGMLQRAAIARALLCDPDVLLADEPFTGLDAPSSRTLESILLSLHERGKTIILANHDVNQARMLAQRLLILNGGRLIVDEQSDVIELESIHMELTRRCRVR